jgi:hypothetical protein
MEQATIDFKYQFEQAYERMVARRKGQERAFLHDRFLHGSRVVRERILEERYVCRAMDAWTSQGSEFKVRNQPAEFPRGYGVHSQGSSEHLKSLRQYAFKTDAAPTI